LLFSWSRSAANGGSSMLGSRSAAISVWTNFSTARALVAARRRLEDLV
jgi:hypothetical protein